MSWLYRYNFSGKILYIPKKKKITVLLPLDSRSSKLQFDN